MPPARHSPADPHPISTDGFAHKSRAVRADTRVVASTHHLAYVLVGRIYKAAHVVSERDGVCVVALEDDRGNTRRFEAKRGIDSHSGLPIVMDHAPQRSPA